MAKLVLNRREVNLLLRGTHEERETIKDTIHTLAGDLGGHGIAVVDESGNDLSCTADPEFQFRFTG